MAVHVVSAFPSVDQWVALVVHVLHVDDGLFACSGSIAVDTLRTEQRNVEKGETYFRSVLTVTPTNDFDVPYDRVKSPVPAKPFMLYVPFHGI